MESEREYKRLAADVILLAFKDLLPSKRVKKLTILECESTGNPQDFAQKKLANHRSAVRFFHELEKSIWIDALNLNVYRLKRAALKKAL